SPKARRPIMELTSTFLVLLQDFQCVSLGPRFRLCRPADGLVLVPSQPLCHRVDPVRRVHPPGTSGTALARHGRLGRKGAHAVRAELSITSVIRSTFRSQRTSSNWRIGPSGTCCVGQRLRERNTLVVPLRSTHSRNTHAALGAAANEVWV